MNSSKPPIFLNFHLSGEAQYELMRRLNGQSEELSKRNGSFELITVLQYGLGKIQEQEFSLEFPRLKFVWIPKNKLGYVYALYKSLNYLSREVDENQVIVAGDIWRAGLIVYLSSYGVSERKSQLSVHGYFNLGSGRSLGSRVKLMFIKKLVPRFTSIRFVSKHLIEYLNSLVPIEEGKTIISHIPIRIPSLPRSEITAREPGILIVGRLHAERGVIEWMNILDRILKLQKGLSIDIVGAGSLFDDVKNWKEVNNYESVRLHGFLQPYELENLFYSKTLFLSTAEHEGFGLAIHEAAARGMTIIAKSNAGVEEAKNLIGDSLISYDSIESAIRLINQQINTIIPNGNQLGLIERITKSNQESLNNLLDSWSSSN
jgi:glycosyltransferase involved in cell wall biosynthesis